MKVDEKNRVDLFRRGRPREGRDPYFTHFYRVNFDGKNLTAADARRRAITMSRSSPDGNYFIDNYSKPDMPPISVLRDATAS